MSGLFGFRELGVVLALFDPTDEGFFEVGQLLVDLF
jgi:hypothetical protein